MRYKRPYSLYKRTVNGKVIYYFRINAGSLKIAKSTGYSSKEKARYYVERLIRDQKEFSLRFGTNFTPDLEPISNPVDEAVAYTKKRILFKDYAKPWWLWDSCQYVLNKRAAGTPTKPGIKQSHVEKCRMWMENYLVPYFGKMDIRDITTDKVNNFLMLLSTKHNLAPKTINNIRSIFSVMMGDAKRHKLLDENPVEGSVCRKVDRKESQLLTDEECAKLFDPDNLKELWNNNLCYYAVNYLSGLTGMRVGELLALTINDVTENEIIVRKTYSSQYGIGTTKNSEIRRIPITKEMYQLIYAAYHANKHSSKYIFCVKYNKPMGAANARRALYRAMAGIGISEQTRKERNITFHSWRHKFTTDCIKANMHPEKIRALTGHKSPEMLARYADLSAADLADQVNKIQHGRLPAQDTNKKKDK